jgi:glycosyltransferase involved in cell wall biosynthesis
MNRRIAILVADLQSGGAQRQAVFLASQWVARGYRVSILTYEQHGAPAFFDVPHTVLIKRLGVAGQSGNALSSIRANIARVKAVREALKELQPEVLLTFLADMTVTGYMAATPLRIPVIACERTDPAIYPTGLWRPMRDIVYPRCARIVCQSRSAADYFAKSGKAIVIPNPVAVPSIDGASDIEAPQRPFIVSLGRLGKEKGHDVLIEAFARIAPLYPDVDLLIIGEGPQREPLEHLVDALGFTGRVHLPGKSKNPFPVMAQAKAFVLPSRFEGFPNALAEAMALGLPSIATRFAGAGDMIEDGKNGILVPLEDPEAMAQSMASLLQYPDKAEVMGQAAKHIADDFAPERIMTLWDRVLN